MIALVSLTIALPFCAAFAGMLLGRRLSRTLSARALPAAGSAAPDAPTTPLPAVVPDAAPAPGDEARVPELSRLAGPDLALRRLPRNGPALIAIASTALATLLALIVATTVWLDPGTREGTLTLVPTGTVDIAIGLQADGLAALVGLMVCLVALAVQIYSVAYLAEDPRYCSYAAFVSLFTAAMLLVVYAADLLLLYVGWEVMGICSYFLIGHHWEDRANSRAAVKAFLMTRLGDVGFLIGIFALGIGAGTFSIGGVLDAVPDLPAGTLTAATLLLLAGVAGKSAQFPLHTWLPDAMAGPTPISALIHAATMVAAGIYVIARLYPAFWAAPASLTVLGIVAVISMVGSALAALAQTDLKRVLAYSTISQLAYMAAGLAVGAQTAAVFHLVTHGAFKALLFLAAGSVILVAGSNLLGRYGGLRRTMPITFWAMTVGYAALIGLPPVSGFFSKDSIIEGARHAAATAGREGTGDTAAAVPDIPGGAAWAIYIALLVTVGITAAYAMRAWLMTFFGEQRGSFQAREAPALMTWTVAALAVPSAVLGFFGLGAAELRPHLVSAGLALLWAAGGGAAAYLLWNRDPARDPADRLGPLRTVFDRAFYLDELYAALVVRPVRAAARAVVVADRRGLDALVVGTAGWSRRAGGALRRIQTGNAQSYLTGLLAGVVVIAAGVVILL
ncbi:NADH-quinone oxidoreductase subunit L [Thermomonospora catenispora]|uniref:NADH-quinone oxidoreductase subunit 5 family protein n=1 Tax=Thermomonospora catenispora TaxID=2493090 RepID=UPI001F50191E|nr:NADH-quinone oxidoreductase subunit L [Thermomonospora catenispora]